MSQLRRQIAVGAVIAILSAVGLGLGVNLLVPAQVASSSTESTIATATSTATSTSTATVVSTSSSISSSASSTSTATVTQTAATTTYTSTVSSATAPTPSLGVNPTARPDPSLGVSLAQSVLLSTNATQIAEQLASVLGESPVALTGVVLPHGPNNSILAYQATYSYRTASGSQIVVTFIQRVFYELDYTSTAQTGQTRAAFTPLKASASAFNVLAGMGLPTRTDRFVIQVENFSPERYTLQWGPSYAGVPIEGTLAKNYDGSYFIQGGSAHFEFDPRNGTPTRIILISPNWFTVGDGFPLLVSSLQAAHIASSYAQALGMSVIGEPQVNFVVINNSLYYVVTVGNNLQAFDLIVNPRTGEVGLPG